MTLFEVLVIIATVMVLVAILLPVMARNSRKSSRIGCVNCLKQVGLAYRIWAGDNDDLYPMQVPVASGGAMELAATGNVAAVFQVMSNELATPSILACPHDLHHHAAPNFISLTSTNLSYFVGLSTDTNYSHNIILCGDANLTMNSRPVKPGVLKITSSADAGWQTDRHPYGGNLGMDDGSVQTTTPANLRTCLAGTGLATNRLAIP